MSENKGADGRPRTLTDPKHFRVRFDGEKLREAQDWCREREISFNSFVRKAVNELLKRVKGTMNERVFDYLCYLLLGSLVATDVLNIIITGVQMTQCGLCYRNQSGEKIAAVAWSEGSEVWVDFTILDPKGNAKDIRLPGHLALSFAEELKAVIPNAEMYRMITSLIKALLKSRRKDIAFLGVNQKVTLARLWDIGLFGMRYQVGLFVERSE
jgi:hypothetical protein